MFAVTVAPDLPPAHIPRAALPGVMLAHKWFPSNPCIGHEQVMISRTMPKAAEGVGDEMSLLGVADLGGRRCLIWENPMLGRYDRCVTGLHEEAHWAGLEDFEPGVPLMDGRRGVPDIPACKGA